MLYDYYKALPRSPTPNYSVYVTHPLQDPYIKKLMDTIRKSAQEEGFDEYQTVEFAAAFVQSLPYTSDLVTESYDEYPRYPAETLVDNGGDCEDTAILMASLVRAMGYGVVLLRFPGVGEIAGHMAVGIAGGDGVIGTYWAYGGRKYYYLETSGNNWKLGQIPDEYKSTSANIFSMVPVPILEHKWTGTWNSFDSNIKVEIDNLGSATAQGVYVLAGFDAGNDMVWNRIFSDSFDVGVNEKVTVTLHPRVPSGKHTRVIVQVIYGGYTVSQSYSDWFDT